MKKYQGVNKKQNETKKIVKIDMTNSVANWWYSQDISTLNFNTLAKDNSVRFNAISHDFDVIIVFGWCEVPDDEPPERFRSTNVFVENENIVADKNHKATVPLFFNKKYQLVDSNGVLKQIEKNSLILNVGAYKPQNGYNKCGSVTFNSENGTYNIHEHIGPIEKVAFLKDIGNKTYELIPFLKLFPSFIIFSKLEQIFDFDFSMILKILNKYNNAILSNLYLTVTDTYNAFDFINIYPNPVTFRLSDKVVIYHPIMFYYCIGDHSPLRSSNFKVFDFLDVSSESVDAIIKWILYQKFPTLNDFEKSDNLFKEIHYIAEMFDELDIIHYSDLFLELSKEIDYQLNQ
jgi:hypothetical protein